MSAPKPLAFALLRRLADGEFHSGQTLAAEFGLSRASIHNALREVEQFGLSLYRVRGRGYRIPQSPQWLDVAALRAGLGAAAGTFSIEVLDEARSSNAVLLQRAALGAPSGSVLAVEWQSAGRGRRGRTWHAALGRSLTFSLLWRFERGLSALSGLSLAAGLAITRALHSFGIAGTGLKWPNDVLGKDGGKLAGILIEAQGDMLGPSAVVIGVGLNLDLPDAVSRQLDQPACNLAQLAELPERNQLLAAILRELAAVLETFAAHGFAPLRAAWEAEHIAQHRPVRLLLPDGSTLTGIARGVAEDGSLRLATEHGERLFNSGEISLRMP
ncbi:biotin--[acetyl-CoA-carboxylase] ligase [Ferriphaselus sp. R-1]|uniref:biotin--[acetyl-CoA-carboxylase] ligase n=1 Tax=Ferriphaselus sp. R-1 TaxID=1485544 RepID=UPI0005594EAF|nr:biotin--[acetyl-CoA-carboxylase] ligase [Ferriphaselus sp. R-1]